mgnify:CR=1 FL=1|tara:strand:+ start:6823 stop:7293 length:471 start_codon:yes stop_codon:yes gene_type:complete
MTEYTRAEIKTMTKAAIKDAFEIHGCTFDSKTAGAVKYTAISLNGSYQRIAAIYGSQGGGASLWIKEAAWDIIKPKVSEGELTIDDVDLTKRGFQWAIHFDNPNDPMINTIVEAVVEAGQIRWHRAQKRRADDARRADARVIREASMAERKRNPFA